MCEGRDECEMNECISVRGVMGERGMSYTIMSGCNECKNAQPTSSLRLPTTI